ncbi:MAG: protein kinase [Kofleriaceae bacterium]|nr:protein kinase [Kofleriaceae bacterium]
MERELGRGGMGSVYAVTHEGIGKRAALKVMHRRLVTSSSAERILQEARVVNQVGHPNIVDIFETGTLEDGRPYIVMERLEGMPLSYRADEGKILPDQVIGILLQVCDALIAAHAANVVHRDLKLDNIFLIDNPDDPSQPRVKLLDWGIAKDISTDVRHTIEGQLVGTPQYLAPEQARGAAVSPQTDVYSLGVMAFELFLEQLPFEAETSAEIMAMHLRATPPTPSELWPDIPPGLESLLLAMLTKDPDSRPTMLTVAHTLELIRSELQRRRAEMTEQAAATIAPRDSRPFTRVRPPSSQPVPLTPAGFAPTEQAEEWQQPSRRWQYVLGVFAIAASAAMFVVSRSTESASAATAKQAIVEEAPPVAELPAEVEMPPEYQIADVAPKTPSVELEAAPARVIPASAPAATRHRARITPSPRKAVPAKPRRDAKPLDPDGTLDPYL